MTTKSPLWQLSTVPVILSIQNVKQALLTTTTAVSGDVTRSVLLTISNDAEKTKGVELAASQPEADQDSSYSPPPVLVDRSKASLHSSQARTIANFRPISQLQSYRSPQQVSVVRPVSSVPVVRRVTSFSSARNIPQSSIVWSSSPMSVVRPANLSTLKATTFGKEMDVSASRQHISYVDMSSRPMSAEAALSNIMAKNVKSEAFGSEESYHRTIRKMPSLAPEGDDDDDDEMEDIKPDIDGMDADQSDSPQERKPIISSYGDMKDYPLKKRPLIIPSEGYSSVTSDGGSESERADMSSSKAELRKKVNRTRPSRRKPKNMDIKVAERFVMVNRGVLEGLMDHVKSNAEPFEERELARRFQKDRIKKCDYCDRTFNYFSKLVEHIRSHTKIKPYVCRICESRFKYKGDLMVHIKQHSEDKPFSCECGRQFATKKYLNVHKRQAAIMGRHPAARPFSRRQEPAKPTNTRSARSNRRAPAENCDYWLFECQECGKRLTCKQDLMEHVRTHTNMEPVFECDTCAIKFEDPQQFEKHMLEHN